METINNKSIRFNLSCVSNARDFMLFVATALILFIHSSLIVDNPVLYYIQNGLGTFGVDLFLFVSGMGLYYSFSNDPNVLHFYKKRAIRILPELLLVAIIWFLIQYPGSIKQYFLHVTLLSFYITGDRTFWYFAFLIPLYLVYPLIFYLQKKIHFAAPALIILATLCFCAFFPRFYPTMFSYWEIAIARIPIFVCGSALAVWIKQKKEISVYWVYTSVIVFIVTNALLFFGVVTEITLYRLVGCPLTISFAILLSAVNERLPKGKVYRALIWIGSLSMELYLVQEKLLKTVTPVFPIHDSHNILLNLVVFAASIVLAYLLQKLYLAFTQNMKRR